MGPCRDSASSRWVRTTNWSQIFDRGIITPPRRKSNEICEKGTSAPSPPPRSAWPRRGLPLQSAPELDEAGRASRMRLVIDGRRLTPQRTGVGRYLEVLLDVWARSGFPLLET